uniref:Ig-like domain-containing protein n=1 Tax=Anopheles maculatus TaxID=74869 RepID=A0A182T8L9_9DIPT
MHFRNQPVEVEVVIIVKVPAGEQKQVRTKTAKPPQKARESESGMWLIMAFFWVSLCSLKDLKIFVPEAVIMGNAATLSCQFELEKATLYSVRWYFEGEEFYRFVPKESPPARTFPVSGITVDVSGEEWDWFLCLLSVFRSN